MNRKAACKLHGFASNDGSEWPFKNIHSPTTQIEWDIFYDWIQDTWFIIKDWINYYDCKQSMEPCAKILGKIDGHKAIKYPEITEPLGPTMWT
jgi:hypothetical protein